MSDFCLTECGVFARKTNDFESVERCFHKAISAATYSLEDIIGRAYHDAAIPNANTRERPEDWNTHEHEGISFI